MVFDQCVAVAAAGDCIHAWQPVKKNCVFDGFRIVWSVWFWSNTCVSIGDQSVLRMFLLVFFLRVFNLKTREVGKHGRDSKYRIRRRIALLCLFVVCQPVVTTATVKHLIHPELNISK